MTWRIDEGDALTVLRTYEDESVNCIVTSPPYWRQRDYGVDGQMGLEQTPEEYIDAMTRVFAECRRVLAKDGTCWVNIGDKWASGGNGGGGSFMAERRAWEDKKTVTGWRSAPVGYKDKDLVGIPWMLAFSMRAEGWYLRQCNIWAKPNGMPESVSDRSTISHEYVFHFSKSNDYWYDIENARTPPAPSSETRLKQNLAAQAGSARANGGAKTNGPMKPVMGIKKQRGHSRRRAGFNERWDAMTRDEQQANGANLRSVWWISPAQYRGDHYAVMPDALAEICITAGCPENGIVLDPFTGVGTTVLVALRLNRSAIGIELNPKNVLAARARVIADAPLLNTPLEVCL